MHTKLVILFTIVCAVVGHDVSIGRSTGGRKIFDEIRQANPAIWRQIENVTIIAPSDEVISGVVVTDMRPDKDGDAQIVDGGEGKDMVTIELKSPTILRGYEFHLEVYTVSSTKYSDGEENLNSPVDESNPEPENKQSTTLSESDGSGDHSTSDMPATVLPENSNKDIPNLIGTDLNENIRPARRINDEEVDYDKTENQDESSATTTDVSEASSTTELPENNEQDAPASIGQDSSENVRPSRDTNDSEHQNDPQINNFEDVTSDSDVTEDAEEATTTELPESSDNDTPILVSEIARPSRETSDENNSEETDSAENIDAPSVIASDASTTELPNQDETTTELNVKTTIEDEVSSAPVMLDNSKNIPDFPSLDILDLIKEKEGTRRIRHTEDNNSQQAETQNNETKISTDNENSEISSAPSVKSNDEDIIDLMPPEVDASYNTEFSDSAQGELPKSDDVDINTSTTESTTDASDKNDEKASTTETPSDEQSRNTRNTATSNADLDSNNVEIQKEPEEKATCASDIGNRNIIMLNGDAVTEDSTRLRYEIPIVLILATGNVPTIKIVLEDNTSETKPNLDNLQPDIEMAENSETNDEVQKNIENADLTPPSTDYTPEPVMIIEK